MFLCPTSPVLKINYLSCNCRKLLKRSFKGTYMFFFVLDQTGATSCRDNLYEQYSSSCKRITCDRYTINKSCTVQVGFNNYIIWLNQFYQFLDRIQSDTNYNGGQLCLKIHFLKLILQLQRTLKTQ